MFLNLDVIGSQVKGAGQDDVGKFELFGSMVGSKCLWSKQYVGRHQVHYNGEWDGWTVSGDWCIPRV